MKILSKIKRRADGDELPKRGHMVEMDLFDTDRNPLAWPSGSSSAWATHSPSDAMSEPWTGPGNREIVVPWGSLTSDSPFAEMTVDNHIKLLEVGSYLVNFEARFSIGFSGYFGSAPEVIEAGALIGVYTDAAEGPVLTRLSGPSYGAGSYYSIGITAPVLVANTPLEIVTVVYVDVSPVDNGNTVVQPQQGTRDWPRNPLQLQIVKL